MRDHLNKLHWLRRYGYLHCAGLGPYEGDPWIRWEDVRPGGWNPAERLKDGPRALKIEPALTQALLADIEAGGGRDFGESWGRREMPCFLWPSWPARRGCSCSPSC